MSERVSVVFPVGPGVGEAGLALGDLLEQSWGDLEILAMLNGCLPEVRDEFYRDSQDRWGSVVTSLGDGMPCGKRAE